MGRTKFIVGGVLILAAVVYLIFSATKANAEYFMTVDELKAKITGMAGQDVRVRAQLSAIPFSMMRIRLC